ncbi:MULTISPECIES: tyrosine-type recombinase/integrase [unclassified Pseudomonas]|uniref:tyrosine-type recombinase/integrase n=1 Tax=unclassified Pseudomonas TaxID=196821 RepID=UPI000C86A1CC|nr:MULTISPECIES: integrase arm-type DNA-binding domain-containing protein [unclassified Pseudomonas]PMV20771.1 integrase [Pseudomonas sp. FW305-3-2-15-C-TSA2]PMV25584.1 integrase [Pseudomonas sp. DP16D-L5]PMV36922.1 integrase [Pseudomonas sp. FW305-3-2-15-A-LB2]PMV43107.1 integrase [Pseudomonas sp. FW305-3-2-15-C-R2A1]PMV49893.1 integrase [Pseudomonas sp. FW305-3-2-15-C-LB1]
MSKLTVKAIEKLIRAGSKSLTSDGNGLYFKVGVTGGTSWIFRYKFNKSSTDMGLGGYPSVSLPDARGKASDARKLLANGINPKAARDSERERLSSERRAEDAKRVFFEQMANEYAEAHGPGWSDKWRRGWLRKLELYAFDILGKLPVGEIETDHVVRVLQPIWLTKTRTADEVRGQIELVLDAAKARSLRQGENPARWRGHLDKLLSRVEKKKARIREHFPAMSWQEVPTLMARLAEIEFRAAVATRLLILTASRAHMVQAARWSEFNLQTGIWTLPAERMKMRKAFSIPLAPEVVTMLEALPRIEESNFLFPGRGASGVMHANAIRNLLHDMGHADITRHGFRSSFRDWAGECTHHPREVCELALAHDERDQTEGAYSRSDLFNKRRLLMEAWATFATTPALGNVIHLELKQAQQGAG